MADNINKEKEKTSRTSSRTERRAERALREILDIDNEQRTRLTWRSVLGGDIFTGIFLRRYVFFILLSNRYACQQEFIEQSHLLDTLQDRQWKLLTITSDIKERTRRSYVQENLRDTTLGTSTQPLYELEVSEGQ